MPKKKIFSGTNNDIEVLTKRIRDSVIAKMGKDNSVGTSVLLGWLVDKLGGEIRVAEDLANIEGHGGSLVIFEKRKFIIWLSPYTSPLRDNFTIAHELGHYFLHYDHKNNGNQQVVFARYGSDIFEWQANRFAAAFLMPRDEFIRQHNALGGDVRMVAGHFEVSRPAVEVRAQSLGLSQSNE
jgi:Zn-dependent peptidase ImmA (M78 family)